MKTQKLSVEKSLSIAIQSEVAAEHVYTALMGKVRNFVLRDKLQFLASEEKKHEQMLRELFSRLCPEQTPSGDAGSLMPKLRITLDEDAPVPDLIAAAMEAEQISEKFYQDLSTQVDDRTAREILTYLASMEHGHYYLLKGEYQLCKNDETYYDRDDFSVDMVHVGP